MAYLFDDWKKLLDNFQQSVEKDLEEIHQQKSEVQQIKTEIFNKIDSGAYYRDSKRIVISAPEVIIGNVDKSGTLLNGAGKVVIKGGDVALDGVGESGRVISRAPSIRQLAVDPGVDGMENVVLGTSEIISQACGIVLHSSEAKDAFSTIPASTGIGGIRIHADKQMSLEAAVSSEGRKQRIEDSVASLTKRGTDLKKQMEDERKSVDSCFKKMADLLDREENLNKEENFVSRVNIKDIDLIHEEMDGLMPALYQATQNFIHLVAQLAEVNRQKKALEAEKKGIKTGDDFKKKTTGASLSIQAEHIDVATTDGDGNKHTNPEAGISVSTPRMGISMTDDKGKLVKDGGFAVSAQNISLVTADISDDGKEIAVGGDVNIQAKNIHMVAVDYKVGEGHVLAEKELTKDSKITMTAKTIEVATISPKDLERDKEGKLTKGEYTAEGDVIFRSKNFTVESLDYEVKDGKLETKALTKDGSVSIRAEKTSVLAADAEGKSTGSINLNAKAVSVKSMDVDKEKFTDDKLAEGSTMTLVSEKMYVGAKSKDVKSKKLQAVSEEMGLFADKTFEAQQGDGKAVVQLDGGNTNVGGSKTAVFGETTINAKAEVKGELKAPKISGDSIEAKSAFKSPNISDGMAAGAGGGGGSLSAKLKTEDAPKE